MVFVKAIENLEGHIEIVKDRDIGESPPHLPVVGDEDTPCQLEDDGCGFATRE